MYKKLSITVLFIKMYKNVQQRYSKFEYMYICMYMCVFVFIIVRIILFKIF
jgi:hypothetical protein